MYKIPLVEIKDKLMKSGKITPVDLESRIKKKINDLSGLISEEGAAHIIANELGVELFSSGQEKLKVKNIYAGMRSISTVGKVMRKFEVREFAKEKASGRVASLIIGDESGTIRVVFWNDQVKVWEQIKENDIISLKDAYAKENNNNKEIHLGDRAEILINPEGEKIDIVHQTQEVAERKKISELQPNQDGIEILGTIVQIFDPRFFHVCPDCNKRINESNGVFNCEQHGNITPTLSYVLNLMLDDGTGTIRGIFWKNQTNHLLGKNETEISNYKEDLSTFEEVKTELLGEQLKLKGRVKRNELFDRLELNVQIVEKANPQEELARMEKN